MFDFLHWVLMCCWACNSCLLLQDTGLMAAVSFNLTVKVPVVKLKQCAKCFTHRHTPAVLAYETLTSLRCMHLICLPRWGDTPFILFSGFCRSSLFIYTICFLSSVILLVLSVASIFICSIVFFCLPTTYCLRILSISIINISIMQINSPKDITPTAWIAFHFANDHAFSVGGLESDIHI